MNTPTHRLSYSNATSNKRSAYAHSANHAVLSMQYMNLHAQFNNVMSLFSTQGSELAALRHTTDKHMKTIMFLKANTKHLETILAAQNVELVQMRAELDATKDRISTSNSLQNDQHILDQTELMGTKLELDAAREEMSDVESERKTLTYFIDKIQGEHKAKMDEKTAELGDALEQLHNKECYIKDTSAALYFALCSTKQLAVVNSQAARIDHDSKVLAGRAEMLTDYGLGLKLGKMQLLAPTAAALTAQHTA